MPWKARRRWPHHHELDATLSVQLVLAIVAAFVLLGGLLSWLASGS